MTGTAERSTRLFVFDPNGAEVRCDSRRTEAVVENGFHKYRLVLNVVVDREGKMRNRHTVMSVAYRVDAGEFPKVVHRLGDGVHEMGENPIPLGGIEILCLDEVEFGEGCEPEFHSSACGTTGFKASLDVRPAVDGNLAGLIKGFTTGKFLSMPRRRDETGVRGFNLRPQIFHGLDLLIRCHAVYGFHYGGHRKNLSAVILSKIVGGDKGIRAQRATTGVIAEC